MFKDILVNEEQGLVYSGSFDSLLGVTIFDGIPTVKECTINLSLICMLKKDVCKSTTKEKKILDDIYKMNHLIPLLKE